MPPQILLCLPKDRPSQLETRLCSEQICTQTADDSQIQVVVERVAMIKHNHCPSTWGEYPVNLADCAGRIWSVVKHSMGIDEVKRAVSERQVLSIALDEASLDRKSVV